MFQNESTYVSLHELKGKTPRIYKKTYDFPGDYIDERHKFFITCPRKGKRGQKFLIDIGIDGWLLPEDALKIYELAYFCKGDILELGTFRGLSTFIIARALDESKSQFKVDTDDIDEKNSILARKKIAEFAYDKYVDFNIMDGTEFCDRKIAEGKRYNFIFIDHWHGYDATYSAAMRAKKLLNAGGFCLFHDYNDPANADKRHHYGVYQAAHDAMICDTQFDFYGTFGSTGLFRKHEETE